MKVTYATPFTMVANKIIQIIAGTKTASTKATTMK